MSSTRRLGPSTATGGIEREGERRRECNVLGQTFVSLVHSLSGFTRVRRAPLFARREKKERGARSLADRAVAKLKDLLKNPTDYWSQFGEDGSYLLAPDRGKGVKKRVMERGAGCS